MASDSGDLIFGTFKGLVTYRFSPRPRTDQRQVSAFTHYRRRWGPIRWASGVAVTRILMLVHLAEFGAPFGIAHSCEQTPLVTAGEPGPPPRCVELLKVLPPSHDFIGEITIVIIVREVCPVLFGERLPALVLPPA